jgi:hypothetical protein
MQPNRTVGPPEYAQPAVSPSPGEASCRTLADAPRTRVAGPVAG